ncbi:hypothetical protein [Jannaschia sp. R86511]|uniref:hypothetical protein n=1 Tax=Jannaschia sp. R86511 TaxID=3093853 RepID=UPI0036D2260C
MRSLSLRGPSAPVRAGVALLGVAALGLVPLLSAPSASSGVDDDGRPVVTVRAAAHTTRVQVVDLVPGTARTVVLDLDRTGPVRSLHARVDDVVDDDGGCVRPELAAGDTTCGPGGGELSSHLTVRLEPGTLDGDVCRAQPVPAVGAVPFRQLVDTALVARARGTGMTCALLGVAHVDSPTDNLTQSDTVTFSLLLGTGQAPVATRAGGTLDVLTKRLPGRTLALGGGR